MSDATGSHQDLHCEQGAIKGEHSGRSRNPVIKVPDIAWLEFEKPNLLRAEAFAQAFGFSTVLRSDDELQLRGSDAGAPCTWTTRSSGSSPAWVSPSGSPRFPAPHADFGCSTAP